MATLDERTREQQTIWSRGDFHRIGVAQVVVGELLVRELQVHAGERVLDVAGGAGNTALAAARRFADVTCSDYVPALLAHARARADTEGLAMTTRVADAQALPFPDASFDVVTSTFGAMFAPDQHATARELIRVLRPDCRLGLASWTPDSWVGAQLDLLSRYLPAPSGVTAVEPPTVWGTREGLESLFAGTVSDLRVTTECFDFVHRSTRDLFALFKDSYGPVSTALARLSPADAETFAGEWIALADVHNSADDGTCVLRSPYLQVVAVSRQRPSS